MVADWEPAKPFLRFRGILTETEDLADISQILAKNNPKLTKNTKIFIFKIKLDQNIKKNEEHEEQWSKIHKNINQNTKKLHEKPFAITQLIPIQALIPLVSPKIAMMYQSNSLDGVESQSSEWCKM